MDEHIVVFEGRVIELKNDSLHFDFKSLEAWTEKHNWYSSKEAADYFSIEKRADEKHSLE